MAEHICACGCGTPSVPGVSKWAKGHPLGDSTVRFWARVETAGPVLRSDLGACWTWTGGLSSTGYGDYWVSVRVVPAHRFAYESAVGPIPEGLHIDHLCRNPPCVRPSHLEPVTPGENFRRGIAPNAVNSLAGQCIKGHPRTSANMVLDVYGRKRCRPCANEARAESRQRKRAAWAAGLVEPDHGTVRAYADFGCRCSACVANVAERNKRYRKATRQRETPCA